MDNVVTYVPPIVQKHSPSVLSAEQCVHTHQGCLLFFDIRRFTKLMQGTFATKHHVIEMQNHFFNFTTSCVSELGGEFVAWDGDGAWFLFTGEDMRNRACEAATTATAGYTQSAADALGIQGLEIAAGIATGTFHLILLKHQEQGAWFIAGPAVREALRAEAAAEPGEVKEAALAHAKPVTISPKGLRPQPPLHTSAGGASASSSGLPSLGIFLHRALREGDVGGQGTPWIGKPESTISIFLNVVGLDVQDLQGTPAARQQLDNLARAFKVFVKTGGAISGMIPYTEGNGHKMFVHYPAAQEGAPWARALEEILSENAAAYRIGATRSDCQMGVIGNSARRFWCMTGWGLVRAHHLMSLSDSGEVLCGNELEHQSTTLTKRMKGELLLKSCQVPEKVWSWSRQ